METKKLLYVAAFAVVFILVTAVVSYAQTSPPPPMLPGMPDQAPLGGLSLLAAAGGAYAWKKLRQRQN